VSAGKVNELHEPSPLKRATCISVPSDQRKEARAALGVGACVNDHSSVLWRFCCRHLVASSSGESEYRGALFCADTFRILVFLPTSKNYTIMKGRLVPVGFRRQDCVNLAEWDGAPRSHLLDPFLDALEQKVGRAPAPDFKALRDYEATWRRFGAPPLSAFVLDQLSQDHEGDRGLPGLTRQQGLDATPRSNDEMPSFLMLAAREWPAVRDSGDRHRLLRFAQHFVGTYSRTRRRSCERQSKRRIELAWHRRQSSRCRRRSSPALGLGISTLVRK
jgi:hypothetical protein